MRLGDRGGKTGDAGDVGRATAQPAFLAAAALHRRKRRRVADDQRADAGRAAELVRRQRDEIGRGQGQLARRLHRIDEQQPARRRYQRRDFGNAAG